MEIDIFRRFCGELSGEPPSYAAEADYLSNRQRYLARVNRRAIERETSPVHLALNSMLQERLSGVVFQTTRRNMQSSWLAQRRAISQSFSRRRNEISEHIDRPKPAFEAKKRKAGKIAAQSVFKKTSITFIPGAVKQKPNPGK